MVLLVQGVEHGEVFHAVIVQTITTKLFGIGVQHHFVTSGRNKESVAGKRLAGVKVEDKQEVFACVGQYLVVIAMPNLLHWSLLDVLLALDNLEHCGIEIAQAFGKKLGKGAHVSVFRNFGTAQVKYRDTEVEFVGARKESYSHDSRKPVVENGTLEDDQNRRDFTINAMAVCLNQARFGELVDPFGGLDDLKERTIRTPLDPDITFSDDPLRMMRCIRFATQLNFYIDDETFYALERNKERIEIISRERIADELNKILLSPVPSKGFVELDRCGLLPLIFPELAAMQGIETKNGRAHKDNFYTHWR